MRISKNISKSISKRIKYSTFIMCLLSILGSADADKVKGQYKNTVILGVLDKVTARTTSVTTKVGDLIKVGSLKVKIINAWRSDPEEMAESKVFLDIVEEDNKGSKLVFRGWMFASSPSISALEHPVYDIWVIEAKGDDYDPEQAPVQEIDEKTSQKIDDLIDQLIDQTENEPDDSTEIIRGNEYS